MSTWAHFSVKDTFNVPAPDTLTAPGKAGRTELTPPLEQGYVFRKDVLRDLLSWWSEVAAGRSRDGLWITGPMGSGKSSLAVQTFARLNVDVIEINGHQNFEFADAVGHMAVVDGDTLFQYGPLPIAMKRGCILLINEADLIRPGELAGMNTVLDGGPLVIAENGGEVIRGQAGFAVVVTANTGGNGDARGTYLGTMRLNGAYMDRFSGMTVGYADPEQELAIVKANVNGLPDDILKKMIEVANGIRELFTAKGNQDPIEVTMSTRTLIRWALKVIQFAMAPEPFSYAMERALTFRAEPETSVAILGIVQRVLTGVTP